MKLETIGKRVFVFGMTWVVARDSVSDDIDAALGNGVDPGESFVYHSRLKPAKHKVNKTEPPSEATSSADGGVLGFFVSSTKLKAVYSAAAALASLGQDGLYVVDLDEDNFWYCGIRGGLVVPSTDLIGPAESIRANVIAMSSGLELPVYASHGASLPGSEDFDLGKTLAAIKQKPMARLSSSTNPLLPIAAIALVAGMGFVGYRVMFPPKPKLTPEQQQALLRQTYVSSVSGLVKDLPLSSQWVLSAYANAVERLPAFIAGWTLEGVSCTPTACSGMYSVTKDSPFAISPMMTRFGSSLKILRDGHSAQVSMPVVTALQQINESFLRSIRPNRMPLMDWVGTVPIKMGGAKIDGQLLESDLNEKFGGGAAGMPPLVMDQASLKGVSFIDSGELGGVVASGSRGGFVPVQFSWSYGIGLVPATWRMTWARLHG